MYLRMKKREIYNFGEIVLTFYTAAEIRFVCFCTHGMTAFHVADVVIGYSALIGSGCFSLSRSKICIMFSSKHNI